MMEYTKEMLVTEAIKRLEALDETLKGCQELINAACEERTTVSYLLWLGHEKD